MSRPECYTDKTVVARKQHKCCECDKTINPGDEYRVFSGIWDGEPDRFKRCVLCAGLADSIFSVYDYDDGIVFGGLFDELSEFGKRSKDWPDMSEEVQGHAIVVTRRLRNEWRRKRNKRWAEINAGTHALSSTQRTSTRLIARRR